MTYILVSATVRRPPSGPLPRRLNAWGAQAGTLETSGLKVGPHGGTAAVVTSVRVFSDPRDRSGVLQ